MDDLEITWALSKQIPDMETGFVIRTAHGDLAVYGHEAQAFIEAANLMMFERLALKRGSEQLRAQLKANHASEVAA